jgi:hypothetical protein
VTAAARQHVVFALYVIGGVLQATGTLWALGVAFGEARGGLYPRGAASTRAEQWRRLRPLLWPALALVAGIGSEVGASILWLLSTS